jgi:hypothetical protein
MTATARMITFEVLAADGRVIDTVEVECVYGKPFHEAEAEAMETFKEQTRAGYDPVPTGNSYKGTALIADAVSVRPIWPAR